MTMTQTSGRRTHRRVTLVRGLAVATALAALAACKQADLDITNPNNATVAGANADPTAFQLLATGLLVDVRSTRLGVINNTGILGREMYIFTPQEGRNTTHYLIGISTNGQQVLDPSGFVTGVWGGEYNALRDVYNFKNGVAANATLTAAGKAAALGFAQTLEALMLFEVVQTRDSLGGIVEIKADAAQLAPFVSRDSMYKYISATLDAAATNLANGGGSFPFALSPGFAGFNTPASFALFTKALKGKVSANYATAGGGAAAWTASLAALNASFLDASATTRSAFDVGVYNTYGSSPDTPNGNSVATNTVLYAHTSVLTDVQFKADGVTPDDRYTAKIRTGLTSRQGPVTSIGPTSASSSLGYKIWPNVTSPVSMIRNEELILLRAEARLATGDKAGAIADLNVVRTNSGGLPPSTLTAASSDAAVLDGILFEKRYSTLMEGNRWVDMRRYNRLNTLPIDITSGPNKNFVARVFPIPQAECQVRFPLKDQPLYWGPCALQ